MLTLPIITKGITLTEIPNRLSAFFEVGNCQVQCKGCHSPHLWIAKGATEMKAIDILRYAKEQHADSIVLMGGLTNGLDPNRVIEEILRPLSIAYPIGLYHGEDLKPQKAMKYLTWLKVGSYQEALGGLDKPTTNQRFYTKDKDKWIDTTYLFRKERYNDKETT